MRSSSPSTPSSASSTPSSPPPGVSRPRTKRRRRGKLTLKCPKGHGVEHLRLCENVARYFDIEKVESDGGIIVLATWPPDIDDEGDGYYLFCNASGCLKQYPLPPGFRLADFLPE